MLLDKEITEAVIEGFISTIVDYIVESVTAPFKHIRKWNRWRKYNTNSKVYKFLVLMGFVYSPTFYMTDCVIESERKARVDGKEFILVSFRDDVEGQDYE